MNVASFVLVDSLCDASVTEKLFRPVPCSRGGSSKRFVLLLLCICLGYVSLLRQRSSAGGGLIVEDSATSMVSQPLMKAKMVSLLMAPWRDLDFTSMRLTRSRRDTPQQHPLAAQALQRQPYLMPGDRVIDLSRGPGEIVGVGAEALVIFDSDPNEVRPVPLLWAAADRTAAIKAAVEKSEAMKPVMRSLLSSRFPQEKRDNVCKEFYNVDAKPERDLDALLYLVDSVKDSPFAKLRLPLSFLSLRLKLGALRRVLALITADSVDPAQRKRALLVILQDLCHSARGIFALEASTARNPEKVTDMFELANRAKTQSSSSTRVNHRVSLELPWSERVKTSYASAKVL